jgi:hypothetical protein
MSSSTTPRTRLSDDLKRILDQAHGEGRTLAQIISILHGRGFDCFIVLLALPFCTPIPLPGLSVPFGIILMLFGARIAIRKKPWLPKRLMDREISAATLQKIIKAALKVAHFLEKLLHPRLRFFKHWDSFSILNGIVIASAGFLLSLPLPPVPFTNGLPALAIVLVAAGMIEEDGGAIFCGYLTAILAWIYIGALFVFGRAGVDMVIKWLGF